MCAKFDGPSYNDSVFIAFTSFWDRPQTDGQTSAQYHNATDFVGSIKSPVIRTNETNPWYELDHDGNLYDVKLQVNR